mgnify:CR=1 FL=1
MFEVDEKGKVFTDVVRKKPIAAVVQTTTHLLRGNLHVHPDERLKNELDRGELAPSLALVESLPHGAGAYDRVRALLEGAAAESAEIGKGTVAQRGE